jgi:hypothetical protein
MDYLHVAFYQKGDGKNKRNRISESGAYTSSSNQDTEEESSNKERRPEGQKKAKERLKGKGKSAKLCNSDLFFFFMNN